MKFLKATFAATAITAFAMSAQAQDGEAYVNLGVQAISFDSGVDGDNSKNVNVFARLGYNFGENFGVEAEGSFNVAPQEFEINNVDIEEKISNSFSGYLVGRYPVSDQFDLFARVGYHTSKVKVTAEANGADASESASVDGIAFGGGAQYNFNENNGIRVGYTSLEAEDGKAGVIDLAYVRKF